MNSDSQQGEAEFDQFAKQYESDLNKGLSLTGESKEYFAQGRMEWVKKRIGTAQPVISAAMDFGCGTGTSTPYFFNTLGADQLFGIDPSEDSLELARQEQRDHNAKFMTAADFNRPSQVDLAFCNGVFHHILPKDRPDAVRFVYESLRPGGLFAFWENNAWNPATRFVMSRVPFDDDAILLFPHQSRRLLREIGFEIVSTDYLFIFPNSLSMLRPLEPALCRLPLGGQYLVLARKPATNGS